MCISAPKDQQFVTSAHINNSPIEGITPIGHAVVLQVNQTAVIVIILMRPLVLHRTAEPQEAL